MTNKEQHPMLPTKTNFSTFTEKDYPYISYIYTTKCKELGFLNQDQAKPCISQSKLI